MANDKKHLRPDRHAHIIPVRKKAAIAKTLHGKTTARPRTVLPHPAEKPSRKIPDISKYVVRK